MKIFTRTAGFHPDVSSIDSLQKALPFFSFPLSTGLILVTAIVCFFYSPSYSQQKNVYYNTPGAQTFTVPAGINQLIVYCYGAGGKGGSTSGTNVAGGGGGGAFTRSVYSSLVGGQTFSLSVGAGSSSGSSPGGDSWFSSTSIQLAKGGQSVPDNSLSGALGGDSAASKGGVRKFGGNGANGDGIGVYGGGGGSGADLINSVYYNGINGSGSLGGVLLVPGGGTGPGKGGNGSTSGGDGTNGFEPGGGGGGASSYDNISHTGGAGANGKIRVIYTCSTYNLSSTAASNACSSPGTATDTLKSSATGLPVGTYTVTYDLSSPATTGLTATMTVTTAGIGTFTITGLTTPGSSIITVTQLASGECVSSISSNNTTVVTVTAPPEAGVITGVSPICKDSIRVFTSNGDGGGAWSSTNTSVATVNSTTGSVTGIAAGTATIRYIVTGTGGCSNDTATYAVTVTAPPEAGVITGVSPICKDSIRVFTSNGDGGGAWSSTNTSVATVNSTTGSVTGIAAGTATIRYIVTGTGGCSNDTATYAVTVTAPPEAGVITGVSPICKDSIRVFTSNGDAGGAWSSTNTSVATVNPTTGSVTGIAAGTATIRYIVTGTGGCSNDTATYSVTVNTPPNAGEITGKGALCVTGYTSTTLATTGDAGGSWFSSNTSVATVNSSGVVTALSSGTTTIFYVVSGFGVCTNDTASFTLVVSSAAPSVPGAINGSSSVCESATLLSYKIAPVAGALTYIWTVPSGWSITFGQGTDSITVSIAIAASSGNVTVAAGNGCDTSLESTKAVTVYGPTDITGHKINGNPVTVDKTITLVYGCITPVLGVTANGFDPLTYQWYVNTTASRIGGAPIAGATDSMYRIPPATNVGTYYYYSVVSGCTNDTSDVFTVTITPQPADAGPDGESYYTGPDLAWIPNSNSNVASVTLSAFLRNSSAPGAECGDIRTARVTFEVLEQSGWKPIPSAKNLPVNFLDPSDPSLGGTASTTAKLHMGNESSFEVFDIRVVISGNYTGDPGLGTIEQLIVGKLVPGGSIAGGVDLDNHKALGFIKADTATFTEASFGVTYTKKGNKVVSPKGVVSITVPSHFDRNGNYSSSLIHYQITSNAITGLSIAEPRATFSSKASVSEYNTGTDIVTPLEGNCVMVLNLYDKSPTIPNNLDSVGVVVYRNAGGVWYVNRWADNKPVMDTISGSDVTVTGTVPLSADVMLVSETAPRVSLNPTEVDIFKGLQVRAYPNPSNGVVNIRIESANYTDPVQVRILDINGRLIRQFEKVNIGTDLKIGSAFQKGIYIVEVKQAGQYKNIRVVKE